MLAVQQNLRSPQAPTQVTGAAVVAVGEEEEIKRGGRKEDLGVKMEAAEDQPLLWSIKTY